MVCTCSWWSLCVPLLKIALRERFVKLYQVTCGILQHYNNSSSSSSSSSSSNNKNNTNNNNDDDDKY